MKLLVGIPWLESASAPPHTKNSLLTELLKLSGCQVGEGSLCAILAGRGCICMGDSSLQLLSTLR